MTFHTIGVRNIYIACERISHNKKITHDKYEHDAEHRLYDD